MTVTVSDDDLQLADYICRADTAFAECFATAQIGRDAKIHYDVVVPANETLKQRIASAFAHARSGNWLSLLCAQCVQDRVVLPAFAAEAARQTDSPGMISLEAMLDENSPFLPTALHAKGLMHVTNYICRISIDGQHAGTGMLVPPDMVMTAGHVFVGAHIKDGGLIRGGVRQPDSARRISVFFDDRMDFFQGARTRLKPRAFNVVDNWLLVHEAPKSDAAGVAEDDIGKSDYALIRLAGSPHPFARPLRMECEPPDDNDPIIVIQHPKGHPLCHDMGVIKQQFAQSAVFLHSANSLQGSSGAPCFNSNFDVIGIHTGEAIGHVPKSNVALGIRTPAPEINSWIQQATPARPDFFLCPLGETRPIVQRDTTLDWLKDATTGKNSRILAISPPQRCLMGMSFTAQFISALLPTEAHLVVKLSALNFHSCAPLEFAYHLLSECGMLSVKDLPIADGETTATAYLRNALIPVLIQKLDEIRDGRLFWLILDDLRRPDANHIPLSEGTGLRECLDLIYEAVAGYDWLRIVLLGYDSVAPDSLKNYWTNETLNTVTSDAFVDYLRKFVSQVSDTTQHAKLNSRLNDFQQHLQDIPPEKMLRGAALYAGSFLEILGVQA